MMAGKCKHCDQPATHRVYGSLPNGNSVDEPACWHHADQRLDELRGLGAYVVLRSLRRSA